MSEEKFGHWGLLLFFFCCLVAMILIHFLRRSKITYFHETGLNSLIGIIVGVFIKHCGGSEEIREFSGFKREIFMILLLPHIIFESGYNLKKRNFFKNIVSILLFAILGTLITAFFVGGFLIIFSHKTSIFNLSTIECLLFGSIISATDPVSVLAIFQQLGVDPDLYANVFGESVLNDAIAIVLVETFLKFRDHDVTAVFIFKSLGVFFGVFLGSFGIGALNAMISAFLIKHIKVRDFPIIETSILFLFAWCTYFLCEDLGLSGIAGILFCGIVQAHYSYLNLSEKSKELTKNLAHLLSFMSESFVFIYLGLAVFCFEHDFHVGIIFVAFFLCLISRFFNIAPLSWINNKIKKNHQISAKKQFVLWFSGLRGAVSFALSVDLPTPHGPVILTTTLIIVLITIFLFGGLTTIVVKKLDVQVENPPIPYMKNKGLLKLERKYIKPFLTHRKYDPAKYDPANYSPYPSNLEVPLLDSQNDKEEKIENPNEIELENSNENQNQNPNEIELENQNENQNENENQNQNEIENQIENQNENQNIN